MAGIDDDSTTTFDNDSTTTFDDDSTTTFDDVDEGVFANWFVREGAGVAAGDTLCEIQIEKVSFDVPAPADGVLEEIVLRENDEFTRDDTLAWITTG